MTIYPCLVTSDNRNESAEDISLLGEQAHDTPENDPWFISVALSILAFICGGRSELKSFDKDLPHFHNGFVEFFSHIQRKNQEIMFVLLCSL